MASSDTERTARVKFDGTAAGLARAAREAERELKRVAAAEKEQQRQAAAAEKELAQKRAAVAKEQAAIVADVDKGVDAIGRGLVSVGTGILKVGGLVGSAQGLAGAAGAVGTLSGALLAVPAVAVAGAIGMATLKLATAGVNDALSAKTPEDYAKATKDMADTAVATTTAIRDQRDELTHLRQTVQGAFFAGLDDDVRSLAGTYLPLLNTGLGGVATELNGMARASAEALLAPSAVDDVNQLLGGTKDLFAELRPAVGNVLSGVLDLSAVGATRLGGLGKAVTGVTQKFKDWVAEGVKSGKVNELIDEGIVAGEKLGQVIGNVAQIGGTLWEGLSDGGDDFLGKLVEGTQAVEDFLNSAQGQDAIRELGQTLGVVADVARDILATALHEVGPLITALGPVTREVAQAFGEALVSAMETVGPLLTSTAGVLSDNKELIGDLVPIVLGLVAAWKGMSIVNDVAGWLSKLPGAFGDVNRVAQETSDTIGDAGGRGLSGRLNALNGLKTAGFTIGALLTIDAATNQGLSDALNHLAEFPDAAQRAKDGIGSGFWDTLFQSPPAKPGDENDARNLKSTIYNHWLESERLTKGLTITPITFAANTQPARWAVDQLLVEVNGTAGTVNINGNDNPAGFALREILAEIAAGKATVTIDGESIPAEVALGRVLAQIDVGSGTVNINGNEIPAGQALAAMLGQINGSSGTLGVNANTTAAENAINYTARDRTVTVFVNSVGSVNGAAVFHDDGLGRAAGGPIFGPGSGTSDTAGLFALSNNEHVWTAAEVDAAGGHAAVMRLRRAVLRGGLTGLAGGGPAVPSYLSSALPLQRSSSPSVQVGGASVGVSVFIDGQEFRGMVRNEIDENNRDTRRAAGAGSGRGW